MELGNPYDRTACKRDVASGCIVFSRRMARKGSRIFKHNKGVTLMRIFALAILISFAGNCYAYVDPGTGVFVAQSIIALVVSVMFYLRNPSQIIRLIKEKFRKKSSDETKKTD